MTTSDSDTEALVGEMRQLRADFSRICDALHAIARQRGGDLLGDARQVGGKIWDEARKQGDGIVREIENKPIAAAFGAFGLGIILGALFGVRRI